MRRVTYLLLVVLALQASKLYFVADAMQADLRLHIANTLFHMCAFALCAWALKRNRSDLGKWGLQICFISFITIAELLWREDMALQLPLIHISDPTRPY